MLKKSHPSTLANILPLIAACVILSACQSTQGPQKPVTPPVKPVAPVTTPTQPASSAKPGEVKQAGFRAMDFSAIPGWQQDNLTEVWPAFKASCSVMKNKPDWREPCSVALTVDESSSKAIREFLEAFFNAYQVLNPDGTDTGLITGYYEPLLKGSRQRGGVYQTPLYRAPSDLLTIDLTSVYPELKGMRLRGRVVGNKVLPYPTRGELLASGALAGNEICWVDDSVDAFFLQVQGSGRVYLQDSKEIIRLAYADQNGQPYKSIGRYLVDKGELTLDQASAMGIKNWIAAHPGREDEVLDANPSYVFFKEVKLTDPNRGPDGALGVPLTEKRSLAVDAQFLPLGAPIFINTTRPSSDTPIRQLMMGQDTGGAIRGAVRADFFWGFGAQAGEMAGTMKQRGMLWVLWPKLGTLPLGTIVN